MKKRTNQYWIDRTNQLISQAHKDSDYYIYQINKAYDRALKDLRSDINDIFAYYANNHNLTVIEAKKMLNEKISPKEIEHLRKEIAGISNKELRKDILARLNAASYKARITRLEALKQSIGVHKAVLADKEVQISSKSYINTIQNGYYKTAYDLQKGIDVGFNVAKINDRTIDLLLNQKFLGKNYSTRVWRNTEVLADKLIDTITSGVISGKSLSKVAKELEEQTEFGKYAAERLVRTETTYFNNQAALRSYKELDLEKYIYVATLDLKTSNICRELDRKIILLSKGIPGTNMPPMHPFCRSTIRAYLGKKYLEKATRRARDPVTGKTYTVGNMSYKEWYAKYVEGNPKALLEEKKLKNLYADKKQYTEYKTILGKKAPKSIEAFQQLKYTDSERWEGLQIIFEKQNKVINFKKELADNSINKHVKFQKQQEHILGSKQWLNRVKRDLANKKSPPDMFFKDINIQQLIDIHAGSGIVEFRKGQQYPIEFIETKDSIGKAFNRLIGKYEKTSRFAIRYSKDGTHAHPVLPRKE